MSVNALRGHPAEFGIIVAKRIGRCDALVARAEKDATLPDAARGAAKALAAQIEDLDNGLAALEANIAAAHEASETRRLLIEVPGIGNSPQSLTAIASLIATAIVAHMPDPGVFKGGRDFAAWPDPAAKLNRRQADARGHHQGNRCLRKLLVLAATSLRHGVGKRKGALRGWIVGLLAKKPARLVTVALANKLARIVLAMMKTGEGFRAETFAKA